MALRAGDWDQAEGLLADPIGTAWVAQVVAASKAAEQAIMLLVG